MAKQKCIKLIKGHFDTLADGLSHVGDPDFESNSKTILQLPMTLH